MGAAVSVAYYLLTRDKNPMAQPEEVIRVDIYNGTDVSGLARRTQTFLREKGYDVLRIGTANDHFKHTIVVERLNPSKANASMLARTLGLNRKYVTFSEDSSLAVAVTLFLGDDYEDYLPDSLGVIP
ncbi:hypothetical protein GF359_10485 [candidate division WOR-3 bacterium]|uniref:LytR/CpsA/Psr regulator C-terminal domain-containing protein n=1 Tax=candidate division WOR-3 bacterium TaxID=2052148 RepID=A0A9D5KAP2_UNCW3|nr:hypothetical protein [candidate division WOR-3 bacterium]